MTASTLWVDPPVSPIEPLLSELVDPTPECGDCGGLLDLVPPALFWYACRACHPATFERS